MESVGTPEITVETVWRTILVTDARDSSKAYFSERSDEALVRIERDRALFAKIAAAHGGEEARDRGDGSMFAFTDPAAALRAAMLMQSEMARLNAALPETALRLVHRMGIQMGSVKLATTVSEPPKRKLSGDIVVTAARLEAICHPGEVCFTNDVYRAIRGTIDHEFRFLDATLKGFDRPMRVWSTRLDRNWSRPLTAEEEQSKVQRREEKRLREKWEREQREQRRRRTALVTASWAAMLSLGSATVSLLMTHGFDPRARLREALDSSAPETVALRTFAEEKIVAPEPAVLRRRAWAAVPKATNFPARTASVHPAAHRRGPLKPRPSVFKMSALVRNVLVYGRFEDFADSLQKIGVQGAEFQKVYDDVRRIELTRNWLQEKLEPFNTEDLPGIRLEPPIAGLIRIVGANDGEIYGVDGDEHRLSIKLYDLPPEALGELVRTVAGGDAMPDTPEAIVGSLAALRHQAGR